MQPTSALRRSYYPTRYYFKERVPLRLKNHISSDYKRISGFNIFFLFLKVSALNRNFYCRTGMPRRNDIFVRLFERSRI